MCPHCQRVQPFPTHAPSFFELFHLETQLELDQDDLRTRFYQLSQKIHPDTQVTKELTDQMHATRWSTLINRAYQTLKDPVLRWDYILELYHYRPSEKSPIPTDLAEAYFELQETLEEGPNPIASETFQSLLIAEEKKNQDEFEILAQDWKKSQQKPELLSRLQVYCDQSKYLASLREDLKKKWSSS